MTTSFSIGAVTGFLGGCFEGAFGKNNLTTIGNYAASALMGLSEGPVGSGLGLAGTFAGRTAGLISGEKAKKAVISFEERASSLIQTKMAPIINRVKEQWQFIKAKQAKAKVTLSPIYKTIRPHISKINCMRTILLAGGLRYNGLTGFALSAAGIYLLEFIFQPRSPVDRIYS